MLLWADQNAACHNVEAEAPQDQQGPSPGIHFHQQLEEGVKSKGGETDAAESQSQRQGAAPGEVSHDRGHHGSEDQPPAQTWRRGGGKTAMRGATCF